MPANLENSAVVTGLEKISFHANPKESVKVQKEYFLSPLRVHSELEDIGHILIKQ